jgi:uncharacterized phage-associated protein
MINIGKVASYFIEKSRALGENNDLTNIKLQRLLYFSQVEYNKMRGEKLFADDLEAWKYGPVARSAYERLKGCGAYPITAFDPATDVEGITEEIGRFLDWIWDKYGRFSVWYLGERARDPKSPWSAVWQNGYGDRMVIPYNAIKNADTIEEF